MYLARAGKLRDVPARSTSHFVAGRRDRQLAPELPCVVWQRQPIAMTNQNGRVEPRGTHDEGAYALPFRVYEKRMDEKCGSERASGRAAN